jgi:hypothetical protein
MRSICSNIVFTLLLVILSNHSKAQSIDDDLFITDFELIYGNDQGTIHDMITYGHQKVIVTTEPGNSIAYIILLSKENLHLDSIAVKCAPAELSLFYDYDKQLFSFKPLFFYKNDFCSLDYEPGLLFFRIDNDVVYPVNCENVGKGNQDSERFYFQSHLVSFSQVDRRKYSEQTVYIDNKEVINYKIDGKHTFDVIFPFSASVSESNMSIIDIYNKELYQFDKQLNFNSFKVPDLPNVEDYQIASSELFQYENGYIVFYSLFANKEIENRVYKLMYFDKDKVIDLSDKLPKGRVFKVNISNQYLYAIVTQSIKNRDRNMMYKMRSPLYLGN